MKERAGRCSVCSQTVFRSTVDGSEWVRPGRKKRPSMPHAHKKREHFIWPDDDSSSGEIRDWELASGAWRWT